MTAALARNIAGGGVAYVAAAVGGDHFTASSDTFLHVKNAGTADCVVTVTSQQACSQGVTHNKTYTVQGSTNAPTGPNDQLIGPLDPVRFADGSGFVQITYSQVTTVTVGLIG